jgi:hypothetical protein
MNHFGLCLILCIGSFFGLMVILILLGFWHCIKPQPPEIVQPPMAPGQNETNYNGVILQRIEGTYPR